MERGSEGFLVCTLVKTLTLLTASKSKVGSTVPLGSDLELARTTHSVYYE